VTDFLRWVLLTLVLTAGFLLLFIWRIPYFITKAVLRGFARKAEGSPWNRFRIGSVAKSGEDNVVMTSPDMVYMFGAFDVTREPVLIHCSLPDHQTYWCISLYAMNTDNFFVRNDRTAGERQFDLVLVGPNGRYQKSGTETVVKAPTPKGVILVRAVVKDRADTEEVARIQEFLKHTTIAAYSEAQASLPTR
jgi:uncharacterized membrane protein